MTRRRQCRPLPRTLLLTLALAVSAPAASAAETSAAGASPTGAAPTSVSGPDPVPEIRPGILAGYLTPAEYPDSLALLPPPPAAGSPEQAMDEAMNARLLTLQGSPRFAMATRDNNLMFPAAADTFVCALGVPVDQARTPYLYRLLRRSLADAGLATYAAKRHYDRPRPFSINGAANCAPESEQEMLSHDPSYPSGHTAIGWAWALILTSLVPERADGILARGLAFGESRAVCNVHWPSDVAAGRTIGAATVAVLQANADFQRDFAAARAELEALESTADLPAAQCALETEAMAMGPPGP